MPADYPPCGCVQSALAYNKMQKGEKKQTHPVLQYLLVCSFFLYRNTPLCKTWATTGLKMPMGECMVEADPSLLLTAKDFSEILRFEIECCFNSIGFWIKFYRANTTQHYWSDQRYPRPKVYLLRGNYTKALKKRIVNSITTCKSLYFNCELDEDHLSCQHTVSPCATCIWTPPET